MTTSGAIQNSHNCSSAQPPTNSVPAALAILPTMNQSCTWSLASDITLNTAGMPMSSKADG